MIASFTVGEDNLVQIGEQFELVAPTDMTQFAISNAQ